MPRVRSQKIRLRVSSLSDLIDGRGKFLQKRAQHRHEFGRHILRQSADARVAGREPRAADAFGHVVNLFAFAERVEEHGHRPDVHAERCPSRAGAN